MLLEQYVIDVIEENEVPLTGGLNQGQFFVFAFVMLALVLVLLCASLYISACMRYRARIVTLGMNGRESRSDAHAGWNLVRLRNRVQDMESKALEDMQ